METNQDKYVADIKECEMLPESDRSLKYTNILLLKIKQPHFMIELLNQFCKRGMFSLILTLSINETILKFGCSIKSFTEKKKRNENKSKGFVCCENKTYNIERTENIRWALEQRSESIKVRNHYEMFVS